MKFKSIVCILGLVLSTVLCAESLYGVIGQAEQEIAKKYSTKIAQEYAQKALRTILDNPNMSDEEKINIIKKKFLFEEQFQQYLKDAQKGNAAAQYNLGVCYQKGLGVSKDMHEAVKWYRKAAEQGDVDAQNVLKKLGETW